MKGIVCEVIKTEKHPNADSLNVYQMKFNDTVIQIVANFENVYEVNDRVKVVLAGAVLKDGIKIKETKIRGVLSAGMALGKTDLDVGTDLTEELCQKKEGFIKYGLKTDNSSLKFIKWPSVSQLHNLIREMRIVNAERKVDFIPKIKLHGCFHGHTKITMYDNSRKPITQIKPGDYVLGVDKNKKIVKTKVLNKYDNGQTSEWVIVKGHRTANESGNTSGVFSIKCTPNHLFWCELKNEYIEAKNLKSNDIVLYTRQPEWTLTFIQKQILIGKMLGDGTFSSIKESAHIEWGHVANDEEYLNWTLKALGKICSDKIETHTSGYGSVMKRARTLNSIYIKQAFSSFIKNNKKLVPEWVADELFPLAIAFWYMDDGSLSKSDIQRDRAVFHTCNFNEKDCHVLIKGLNRLGMKASIIYKKKKLKKYPMICLDTDSSEILFSLIVPYIPSCMQRKLPEHYKGYSGTLPKTNSFFEPSVVPRKIVSVEKYIGKGKKHDIETETHNYFANGVLVHNSNAGVVCNGKNIGAQKRTSLISLQNDNAGFCRFVEERKDYFAGLNLNNVTIFGEAIGEGIQKGTAANKVKKSFCIFGVFYQDIEQIDINPETIKTLLSALPEDVYILPFYNKPISIDFTNPVDVKEKADEINTLIAELEKEDPWIKEVFNVSGNSEGLVYYPVSECIVKDNGQMLITRSRFENYSFKAKSDKFEVVNKKEKKPVQTDPELIKNVKEFVDMFVTENRLNQILDEVCPNKTYTKQKIGEFLAAFMRDVGKESVAELEKNNLIWKNVSKDVGGRARLWFLGKCNE